jgi:hypothetical protein
MGRDEEKPSSGRSGLLLSITTGFLHRCGSSWYEVRALWCTRGSPEAYAPESLGSLYLLVLCLVMLAGRVGYGLRAGGTSEV